MNFVGDFSNSLFFVVKSTIVVEIPGNEIRLAAGERMDFISSSHQQEFHELLVTALRAADRPKEVVAMKIGERKTIQMQISPEFYNKKCFTTPLDDFGSKSTDAPLLRCRQQSL